MLQMGRGYLLYCSARAKAFQRPLWQAKWFGSVIPPRTWYLETLLIAYNSQYLYTLPLTEMLTLNRSV